MAKTAQADDALDHCIKFLAKREGIDKTLKIIRYTARLIAAVTPDGSEINVRFAALEKSVGVSRKAYRLGKFLQDINNLRKSNATGHTYLLEALAYGGEGVYYFLEQFAWLMKAGMLTKAHEQRLSRASAAAELVGYAASIWLGVLKLRALDAKVARAQEGLDKRRREEGVLDQGLEKELVLLQRMRAMRVAAMVQDLADSCLAANDVRGGRDPLLSHPAVLALAGLMSAFISFHKNWTA